MLRANGVGFAVDEFVNGSSLFPCDCRIYRKGEPMFPKTQPNGRVEDHSGVNIRVSDANWDNLEAQIEDAIAYLKKHKEEVERLVHFPGVEIVGLDFGVNVPDQTSSNFFPSELLWLAGSIGIGLEITYY